MKPKQCIWIMFVAALLIAPISCATHQTAGTSSIPSTTAAAQVPSWSAADMDFFLHGSMSTEIVPEKVLRAFMSTYPDLFPSQDLSHLGLIPDPAFGWPVGFSRSTVPHLGGLPSVGVNCAACHVGEMVAAPGAKPIRVLGMTSHFDAEAFFGAVIISTFRTESPTNMGRFLEFYLTDKIKNSDADLRAVESQWQRQEPQIIAAMTNDLSGSQGLAPGALNELSATDLRPDPSGIANTDLASLSHSMLKLFHNMRASLHVPDQPPTAIPPPSGPGRNDAFGALSLVLFGEPQPYAPVKYGLVWNVANRHWVHWDGNTQSPLARNLLASLGLGAPLQGHHGDLDFVLVKRQTDLSELIQPPRYPFAIDTELAKRGAGHFEAKCASCHSGPENDTRLHSPAEIGTQPLRAELFNKEQAGRFDVFLAQLETAGYVPPAEPGIRSTQKYWAPSLAGVWARSPYLHNGSVRTMAELLGPSAERAKTFRRGSRVYDAAQMGYADDGAYVFDTAIPADGNSGHEYGSDLTAQQKLELIEYLKTL